MREIEVTAASGIIAFHRALQKESTPLLQWNGESASLLQLLSDGVLQLLDEAFKPRRRVHRNLDELSISFQSCRTRVEFETAFMNWLDSEDGLSSDDEIVIE